MIPKKEFYFIRHGQTDQNVTGIYTEEDIPLNPTGMGQAKKIESVIATLPIQTVCHSPLLRARQTKELITPRVEAPHFELQNLTECNIEIWNTMTPLGKKALQANIPLVTNFMKSVAKGLIEALSYPGPVLVVAHGGVHWAICHYMDIASPWHINNCVPVHFVPNEKGEWVANYLVPSATHPV